jgi:hypothetical protein
VPKSKPEPRRVSRGSVIHDEIVHVDVAKTKAPTPNIFDGKDVILKARKGGRRWLIHNGGGRAVELKGGK